MKRRLLAQVLVLTVFLTASCTTLTARLAAIPTSTPTPTYAPTPTTIGAEPEPMVPCPASVRCEDRGFATALDSAGSVGYCIFDDNTACEEWSYYRNECGRASPSSYDFYDELTGSVTRVNETLSRDGSVTHVEADYCISRGWLVRPDKQKLVNHLVQYYISEAGELVETYRVDVKDISCCDALRPSPQDSVYMCE